MSNNLFPALAGLSWDVLKTPQFNTSVQKSVSGRTTRATLQPLPIWLWTLTYDYLPQGTDLATLVGFFLNRRGRWDPFLFTDPNDKSVTGQALGAGDGVTTVFYLVRGLGGFVEPVENATVAQVYKAGVAATGGTWSVTSGANGYRNQITFTTAPALGVAITADFTYSWRVAFLADLIEFANFSNLLWSAKTVELESVKL